jgi:hypothetical protein
VRPRIGIKLALTGSRLNRLLIHDCGKGCGDYQAADLTARQSSLGMYVGKPHGQSLDLLTQRRRYYNTLSVSQSSPTCP